MKVKSKKSIRRVIAFVSALTIVTSATMLTGFADKKTEVVNNVDDYTSLFPGLTDTKMKLSDPVFSEKDWYEYIEYEFYTEVIDGDMTYRIYKPTDFSEASIMAIGDYNPKEILGNTTNLSMNLGELQGIFDMAQQGSNISKDFVGLDITSGIAENMNNIGEVMDNSKYYSKSSFLGIPGDKKYTGVSNDSFFNADSLEIEIVESETISTCKTIAMDSSYSISDVTTNEKNKTTFKEAYEGNSNTHEEQTYKEDSNTSGKVTVEGENQTTENHNLTIQNTLEHDLKEEINSKRNSAGSEFGVSGIDLNFGITCLANLGEEWGTDKSETTGTISENGSETGTIDITEKLDYTETNVEETNMTGQSSGDSSTIEHGLTSGNEDGVTYSNAKEMAAAVGYGVDYQYGNEHSLTLDVTRIFNAREDEEVKNVGWKLCEYVVKVPYYIEAVKTDATGEENVLYGQYVNYNLLNGVCRVFANGYIEHWYTGELVAYADFFDGFVTATELVDKAKAQQAEKADMLS